MSEVRVVGGLRDRATGREHTLRVYLPTSYSQGGTFPVLLLCDGQNLFDRGQPAVHPAWGVDSTMDALLRTEAIAPWIVVGIDHDGVGRLSEYASWNEPRAGVLARGDGFVTFVLDVLVPTIASNFRVRLGHATTGIGGSSMGGLMALTVAARAPHLFGRVLAMSPTVMWRDDAVTSLWTPALAPRLRVYLDAGVHERFDTPGFSLDYGASVARFARHLHTIGYDDETLRVVLDPDGRHSESDWRRRLPQALAWLLA